MTFEIWQTNHDGAAALMIPLRNIDRRQLEQQGCRRLSTIEADSIPAAQDRFTEWCRTVCPGAEEHEADPGAVQNDLRRALKRERDVWR